MRPIILLLSLVLTGLINAQEYPQAIPEFEIFTLKGETFSSEEVQNENYSFFIYFNPECGHCKTAFEALNLKAKDIKDANVTIYPVSSNTEEKTKLFFKGIAPDLEILENIKILRDDDFKFADMFSVGGYPMSFLYDKNKGLIKVYDGTTETISFLDDLK